MGKVIVQSRVQKELKDEAEEILDGMGLTVAEAIRLFLTQTVTDHRFPFVPRLRQPSTELNAAIKELDDGAAEHFDDIDQLEKSWSTGE